MTYIWQHPEWPEFQYNLAGVDDILFVFAEETGHVSGILKGTPDALQVEALIDTLVAEAIKTSAIEGEFLTRQDVVSSIRNNLGIAKKPEPVKDRKAQGAATLMVAARNSYAEPLTEAMLFAWHETILKESKTINIGAWRKDSAPMQVVSGSVGREKVHFEAPPSERVPVEMAQFIEWFNATAPGGAKEITKAPVRSAIAHLYFETIHPFEDGNGRIGRVIAEKALSQTLGRPVMLSLSRKIEAERKKYYQSLETAQKNIDITDWIRYFVQTIVDAQIETRDMLDFTLQKTRFLDRFKDSLNERETKVVQKMLETGPGDFEGGMTAKKYMSIAKTSKATATRDLQHLAEIQCLIASGGGRSTSYQLPFLQNTFE
ncbi:Fic family protein [Dyadobacter sp. OTU695]|uniref:Fic family protein n=1 Tax=Dyadobacter sp. OTU695 TaxID=3043860 RepID=UPI00313ED64F